MSREVPLLTSVTGTEWSLKLDDHALPETVIARTPMSAIREQLDFNKRAKLHNDGYSPTREMRRVASIPLALIQHWKATEGWDAFDPANADKLAQKLMDPDYAHLRTAEGRVGVTNGVLR